MDNKGGHILSAEEESKNIISYKGHNFFILQPNSGKTIDELIPFTCILINATHTAFCNFTIQRLRGSNNPNIYLKPIFFLRPSKDSGPYINSLIDGSIFDLNQLETIVPIVEELLKKNELIYKTQPVSYEAQLILKTLSFAQTRNRNSIEPFPFVFSSINFSYPGLSPSFDHIEEFKVFEILETAEKDGLLKGSFFEKTHFCNQCNHGSLNYRSACPKCNYTDSITQDIIHHFPCGYVGPMNDFKNELDDTLNCPKCNKILRHIGVDYDKPSIIHYCNKCNYKFQEFVVKAKCLSCGFDNDLEQLIEKDIKTYSITNKGENITKNGYLGPSKEIESIIGTVKYEFFILMIKHEVERIKENKGKSNIGMIYIDHAGEFYSKFNKEIQQKLFTDIVTIIRYAIKNSDVISFKDASTILLTIYDNELHNATKIIDDIVILLEELVESNLKNININFITNCVQLNNYTDYNSQINNLINNLI